MHLDALARAAGLDSIDVLPLADGTRAPAVFGIFGTAFDLMDAGAQSPKETWLRLLLIDAGYAAAADPDSMSTDGGVAFAFLDMG